MEQERSNHGILGLIGRLGRAAAAATLSIGLLSFAPTPSSADEGSAQEVVEQLNRVLIGVMREADTLGYRGRLAKLSPVLNTSFNYPLMARIAVSQHWKSLSAEQKSTLGTLFARLSSATFAARFDGYSGEVFRIIDQAEQPRNTVLITNHLIKPSGEVVGLNYLLREAKGRWRIIDVYLDAKYSELAIKRSEFTSVIAQNGFEALIAEIQTRIAKIEKSAGG